MSVMTLVDFLTAFDRARHRVFRLETLDHYESKSERTSLARFRAGEPQDPTWLEPWWEKVGSVRGRGVEFGRVHVVTEPLSEYVAFEMTCAYPANIDAGEDIGILPRTTAEEIGLPEQDYWLIDDAYAGRMVYDDQGALEHVEVTEAPDEVRELARWRSIAQNHAVPALQYMTEIGLRPRVGLVSQHSEG